MFQLSHPECQLLQTNSLSDDTIWRWNCDHPCEVEHRDCSLPQMHGGEKHRRDSWQPKGTASFANVGRIPRLGRFSKDPFSFPMNRFAPAASQKNQKLYPWNSLPWLFLPQGNNFSQLRVAFRKLGLCRSSSLILEDVITLPPWHAGPTNGNRSSCWAYVGLVSHSWGHGAQSSIFWWGSLHASWDPYGSREFRFAFWNFWSPSAASAASARFLTLPLSEIVPSSEILIECHIDLEASFKALLTVIPVDHLEWDEPLKNISCSGERSRLFQWESHSLCLSLFFKIHRCSSEECFSLSV